MKKLPPLFHRTPVVLGVIASVIAIGGLALTAFRDIQPKANHPTLPEQGQIITFHQLANRMCTENKQAMNRAFPAAHSRSELLGFLARATGWGVRDLSSVTPPQSMSATYVEEVLDRRRIAAYLLNLQRAMEIGDRTEQARIKAKLATAETRAANLNRSLGLVRCAPVLPPRGQRLTS